jgi:uncharacterized protein (DUF1684 family)
MRSLFLFLLLALATIPAEAGTEYTTEIDDWHAGRIDRLKQPGSWLTVVGLVALPEGQSSLGTGEGMDFRIEADGPSHIGDLIVDGMKVEFIAASEVRHQDEVVQSIVLASDITGDPTILNCATLTFYLIERHERPYLRVKDANAPLLKEFDGIERWPVDEGWRIEARWIEYETPKKRLFPDVLGVAVETDSPGEARFSVNGTEYVLYPTSIYEDSMFFVFGDATNGIESYGAGRMLYTDPPDDEGRLFLDFNRSYNPPCVFTPFATCPLPAVGNTLELEITAGEMMFGEDH